MYFVCGYYFLIEPIDKPNWLQKALEIFVKNTHKDTEETDQVWIAKKWQEKDMIDFMISRITPVVLENINRLKVHALSKEDRYKLIAITCLYYPESTILKFDLLRKLLEQDLSYFSFFKIKNINNVQETDSTYEYILQFSNSIDVLERSNTDRLKILSNILSYFGIMPSSLIFADMNREDILLDYINIMKRAGLDIILVLDGIDEVPMFGIMNEACSGDLFKAVIKSTKSLLDMATMQQIHLILFVPDCSGDDIKEVLPVWIDEKVLHFSLDWEQEILSDYANYVLSFFRGNQDSFWGHRLPRSFSELVGGDECANLFLSNVSCPRQFNALFSKFIRQLNIEKNKVGTQVPFVGSQSCSTVKSAIGVENIIVDENNQKRNESNDEKSDL